MIKKKFFPGKLIKSTNSSYIILRKYSVETIVSAFEYFCFSRSCYSRLRRDFELPSISTLSRLTSITKNTDDTTFLQSVISSQNNRQKNAVFLIDKVYVKPTLQYCGGTLFGHAANKPDVFANTILTFMLKFIGGPKFVCKMIPVRQLDANFLFQHTQQLLFTIKDCKAQVVAIICDRNRVNQAFF